MNRWNVILTYRTANGPRVDTHNIEELFELDAIVEGGPDWNALIDIKITLARGTAADDYTIEDSLAA